MRRVWILGGAKSSTMAEIDQLLVDAGEAICRVDQPWPSETRKPKRRVTDVTVYTVGCALPDDFADVGGHVLIAVGSDEYFGLADLAHQWQVVQDRIECHKFPFMVKARILDRGLTSIMERVDKILGGIR